MGGLGVLLPGLRVSIVLSVYRGSAIWSRGGVVGFASELGTLRRKEDLNCR